ncbi:glycosyltransferase family 2 protein [Methylosinus sp. R-45379]|uniref:glycosyltransferase family 2 protein n=1 Tax=Methylosinus sp. R-45379 TaxID=980563 RepID=UPI0009FF2188|nr:glycosyltransferase family 2 protein [Methylosinus sp. R-45379]
MKPIFSIITVCRNDLPGLKRTCKSVYDQTFNSIEWVIIDGGSTDGAYEFLTTLAADNFNWISEPDAGIYDAMNKGIQRSSGIYCVFMNAGDEFAFPNTLEQVSKWVNEGADILYGDAIEVTCKKAFIKKSYPATRYWYSMFTHHQAIFYLRQSISSGYDDTFRLAADWALTSRIIRDGGVAVYLKVPICKFYRGGASDNPRLRGLADKELWRIYREVHGHGRVKAWVLYVIKRGINLFRLHADPIYALLRMHATDGREPF